MESDDEFPKTIVVDAGSAIFRSGIAEEDVPRVVFPSLLGSCRFPTGQSEKWTSDSFVGSQAQEKREFLSLRYPIQRGTVTDWDGMETLMTHNYKQLSVEARDHPHLFSQPPLSSTSYKETLAQFMFETFDCNSLYLEDASRLCLYASGRNTGVMVNVGDGISFATPFYESHWMAHGIQRQDFAGSDVTLLLQKLLNNKGFSLTTTSDREMVKEIKEKFCYTALDADLEKNAVETLKFSIDNDLSIDLKDERYLCTELLLNPSRFGFSGLVGIQDMIANAIKSCEYDTRTNMLLGIFINGGCSRIPGFVERLRKEVKQMFPSTLRIHVHGEGSFSQWIGGSILGSLTMFQHMFISKQTYEENGPRCFRYQS